MTTVKNNTAIETTATIKKQGENTMKTTANTTETAKRFTENSFMLNCADIIGANLETGINYSAMNDESNFIPYVYLLLTDEKCKKEAKKATIEAKLKEMPTDKNCTADERLEKSNLRKEKNDIISRLEAIAPILDTLNENRPTITPLAAMWAYSKSTKTYANGEACANQSAMLESVTKLHKHMKNHLEEVAGFAKEENRKGQVYKDMKKEMSTLFSLLFGTAITANASDVAWMCSACTIAKGGVKGNNNAITAKVSIVQKATVLREACNILTSKLQARENEKAAHDRADGKDSEIVFAFMEEPKEKDSDVITIQ